MGGGRGLGSRRQVKTPIQTQRTVVQCMPSGHKLIQSTKKAKAAMRSSLVPHAVLLMHPAGQDHEMHNRAQ